MLKNHKDIGWFKTKLEWESDNVRLALVSGYNRGYWDRDCVTYKRHNKAKREYLYCLWGSTDKPLEECTAVECRTPSGYPQTLKSALRIFNKMVDASTKITFK